MQTDKARQIIVVIGAAFVLTLCLSAYRAQARPCYTDPIARARGSGGETVLCVAVGQSVSLTAIYPSYYSYDPDNGAPCYPGKGISEYSWNMGDEYYYGGASVQHTYSQAGEYGVQLKVKDDEPWHAPAETWITVWVVAVNVNAGLTEAEEENPGLYINVNWSDDDGDGWTPNEDPPDGSYEADKDDDEIGEGGDNDFRAFGIGVDPQQAPVTVVVEFQNNIEVWKTFSKKMPGGGTSEVFSGAAFDPQSIPSPLLIEGQSGTENFRGVSLTATVKYGQNEICSDTVKITVFEVTLTGFFSGNQHTCHECEVRHVTMDHSSDENGKISWDDADGDGESGDLDPHCEYFHSCMECRGTVKPAGVTTQAEFLFGRWVWAKAWEKSEGGGWELAMNHTPWHDDNILADEDTTPSFENCIYEIDGPGETFRDRGTCDYVADIGDLRECVFVRFGPGGTFRQCSDWYKWHYQIYLKPKQGTEWLTRDGAALQKLGASWINVPDNP